MAAMQTSPKRDPEQRRPPMAMAKPPASRSMWPGAAGKFTNCRCAMLDAIRAGIRKAMIWLASQEGSNVMPWARLDSPS